MNINNTESAAIAAIGIVAAAVIISDDSESGVVPTVQRIVPGSNDDSRFSYGGGRDFQDSGNDGTGMFDQTLTDGENPFTGTDMSGSGGGGGNRDSGNDGTGMFDQTLTDGENPFTGTDVSGSGGGRDFQDSVNQAFSDFV